MTLTDTVKKYLDENEGWVEEGDRIRAIVAILKDYSFDCDRPRGCTETNKNADIMCGTRSLVEHAMGIIHHKG